ncbi:MAG: hypothetical protein KO464_05650 [Candidatus Methanofastidiosum sp.]|nr:hypothetical protein [Methanofastidiosum sp.]
MEKRTESERIADLESAKAHRELAEDPLSENMPGRKEWHMEEAKRLVND